MHEENELEPAPPPRRRGMWIALVMVAVAIAAVVFLWVRYRKEAPPPPAPAAAPAAVAPPAPAPPGPPPVLDAARLRSLLESVSSNALFRGWVGQGDLLRRWAIVTDNLAEGVSPRRQLSFSVARPFSVVHRGQKTFIAPESYKRFDDFVDAVASVDARSLASVYREVHGALEAAYRALGYPNASIDRVTAKALRRIEGVPVLEGNVEVESEGAVYGFVDPRLERLGPVEKQMLRMGPSNVRRLQAKARELREALGLGSDAAQR